MKKTLLLNFSLLFIVLFVFVLTGCSKTGSTGPSGTPGYVMQFQNGNYPSTSYAGCYGTGLDSYTPNTNYYMSDPFNLGSFNTPAYGRYLVKFDISNVIPNNVNVTGAFLTLNVTTILGNNTYTCYELSSNFDLTSATYNDYQTNYGWTTPGGDFYSTAKSDSIMINSTGMISFKLDPTMVENWILSPSANYGVIIKGEDETSGYSNYIGINGIADSNSALTPELTIYYTLN